MRHSLLLLAFLYQLQIVAQSNLQQPTSINADGATPAVSAILDVQATDKGVLIPRMTSAERNAIASPATGLLVFDTTMGGFWFYNGTAWASLGSGGNPGSFISDADNNTKVQTEKSPNENIIRFDLDGTEYLTLRKNAGNIPLLEVLNSTSNTFIGQEAGSFTTTGSSNTAIGRRALYSNTSGNGNTAYGVFAMYSNTLGFSNTANGTDALYSNTIGGSNSAHGRSALFSNTSGSSNTASGTNTLYSNTTGAFNTASGRDALYSNTTGYQNTASGIEALYSNTTGFSNTAIGADALFSNTAGIENIAIGLATLSSNSTGSFNTAIGKHALLSSNGSSNTACGTETLKDNITGFSNTAIGILAADNGSNNTLCTAIGSDSDVGTNTNSYTNAIAIGYDANTAANNFARIGNTSITSIGGQVGWSNYSDGRFKRSVEENVVGLEFIKKLRPVTYQWDIHALNNFIPNTNDSMAWEGKYDIERMRFSGFIAQEVEQAAQAACYDFSGVDKPQNERTPYSLRYAEFVVPLVKALQEQQEIIEHGKLRMENLEKENTVLKTQLDRITSALQGVGISLDN